MNGKMYLQTGNNRGRTRPGLSYTQRFARSELDQPEEKKRTQADREKATFTCCHGRKLDWKQARVIVERSAPNYSDIPGDVCLYDILLRKEIK